MLSLVSPRHCLQPGPTQWGTGVKGGRGWKLRGWRTDTLYIPVPSRRHSLINQPSLTSAACWPQPCRIPPRSSSLALGLARRPPQPLPEPPRGSTVAESGSDGHTALKTPPPQFPTPEKSFSASKLLCCPPTPTPGGLKRNATPLCRPSYSQSLYQHLLEAPRDFYLFLFFNLGAPLSQLSSRALNKRKQPHAQTC